MGVLAELIKQQRQQAFDKDTSTLNFYMDAVKGGNLSPVPNPNNDPAVDAENTKRQQQRDYAQTQITKLGGKDPQSKGIISTVFGHLGKMHKGVAGGDGGATTPPSPGGTGSMGNTATTAANGGGGTAGTGTPAGAGSGGGTPGLPPPPSSMQQAAAPVPKPSAALPTPPSLGSVVGTASQSPEARAASASASSLAATEAERTSGAKLAGLTPGTRDFQEYMATGKFPTIPRMTTATYTVDGNTFTGAPDPVTGKIVDVDSGEVVPNATKVTAGMLAAPSVKDQDGVPSYIVRDGKSVYPNSPDWTKADQGLYDTAMDSYRKGEAAKQARQQASQDAYAKMRGKVTQYGVIDNDTGALTYVNADTINASPEGKYSPAAQAQQQRNRSGIFDEIDASRNYLNTAIDSLGNDAFSPTQRAQVALVLSDKDPASALQSFLGSDWASSLSDSQVKYITALANMQESAMSLRSIAGMGAGSDKLRGAIQAMLPGPGTPSKAYAQRQMQLFNTELQQLRKSIPTNINVGQGGGAGLPPPPSASSGGATKTDPLGLR